MAEMVNFYEELKLKTDWSVGKIQEVLRTSKLGFKAKAMRGSGSLLDEFKRKLELIRQAEEVFKDEDSRERYDILLKRADTPEVPQQINWVTQAWTYYFSGDDGAAVIAARKAKEQSPDQPMAYVVSAWVQLREGEPKQAKRDADEAFVLDELGADSVDVQEVRGAVYFELEQYERALASFERGLARASDGEKPELYWRKAVAHLRLRDPEHAFNAGMEGLSQRVELPAELRENLELVITTAIHLVDDTMDPDKSVAAYARRREYVASAPIDDIARFKFLSNIDANIERCSKVRALHVRRDRLQSFGGARGARPGVSFGSAVLCVILVILGAVIIRFSQGYGILALISAAVFLTYFLITIAKRSQWQSDAEEYLSAQQQLQPLNAELAVLREPIPLRKA